METFKPQEARADLSVGLALRLLEQSTPEAPSNLYDSGSLQFRSASGTMQSAVLGAVVAAALRAAGRLSKAQGTQFCGR